ncbi:hypothetical protein Tco_0492590 [Tanacetum coccineum]
MEAHCVNLELKYQNQALKEGQHGQFPKIKSNEAKVKHDIDVIETINIELEHKEKGFAIASLKNELRKLTGNSVNIKFAKSSILGKQVLQPHRNQLVVRQPTAFKAERPRISKPRFASQVDVNNDLSKPVSTYYLPKEREFAVVKPHHVIASRESRNSSKNMPRFSSNDMVHNHYLDEARKKTQEKGRNSEPSVMPSAKSQSTTNDCKPKPRINNQKSRNWPASKTSYGFKEFKSDKQEMTSDHNSLELGIHDHDNEPSSSKLVPKVVPPTDKTATSRQELGLLFHHHITMLRSTCTYF